MTRTLPARAGILLVLAASAAAALWLATGMRAGDEADPNAGLRFDVSCQGFDAANPSGTITCSVTVKGLPDPLDSQVTVKVSDFGPGNSATGDSPVGDSVSASEAPSTDPGSPALITRQQHPAPPSPTDLIPEVPEQPPRVA